MANESKVMVTAATTLVTTAETQAATSASVPENQAGAAAQGLVVRGVLNILAGTGTTAVQVRVRAGNNTLTGAQIGPTMTHTLAAAATAQVPFEVVDTTLVQAGAQYTVTVQQVGASANGTVNLATVGSEPVSSAPG